MNTVNPSRETSTEDRSSQLVPEDSGLNPGSADLPPPVVSEGNPGLSAEIEALPALTIREAARFLGRSLRALERSIVGKWGNRLPAGWRARKVKTSQGVEWRIIPPPGFRVRQVEGGERLSGLPEEDNVPERALPASTGRRSWALEGGSGDSPAIVIDRADEIEELLRELLKARQELAEERRQRMEDIRLMSQMQLSMRLLEDRAANTAIIKGELESARQEMMELKQNYLELLSRPWWKRLFRGRG